MKKQLSIKNLQSHVDTTIEFLPGVNMLTGPSDCGKSAVIRSLKNVAQNRPSGDSLRRHRTKKTEVTLDGVTKLRTASKHQYEISGEVYKALGTDVPKEVSEILNLGPENFQEQHEAYFLLVDTPGKRAKTLNKVADLQIIDDSRDMIKRKIRENKVSERLLADNLEEEKAKLESMQWAREADADYKKVEALQAQLEAIDTVALRAKVNETERLTTATSKFKGLDNLIAECTTLQERVERVSGDSLQRLVIAIEEQQVSIPDVTEDLVTVRRLIGKLETLEDRGLLKSIEDVKKAETAVNRLPDTSADITLVRKLIAKLEKAEEGASLIGALNEAVIAEDCLEEAIVQVHHGQVGYDNYRKEIGSCPLCGGNL